MAISIGGVEFGVTANLSSAKKELDELRRRMRLLEEQSKKNETSLTNLSSSAQQMAGAMTTVASGIGAVKLGGFLKESTLLAGRVENLGTIIENVGRIAGFTSEQITRIEGRVKKLGITTQSARQSLALMAQSQLDLSQATKLARIAQDAAVISGTNSSEAFSRLVVGVQRTNTFMLRNLGIMVNLQQLYQNFALQSGRVVTTITAQEKQQILLNEVLRKGALITGTYEAAMGDAFKQFTSLDRLTEEASRTFGEQLLPVFAELVTITTKLLKSFIALDPAVKSTLATIASGIVIFAGIVAVVGAATFAFTTLLPAILAINPAFLLIAAAAAVTTAIFIKQAADIRNQAIALREASEQTKAYVDSQLRLKDAIDRVKALGKIQQRTAEQQTQLNQAMADAILLAPRMASELQQLTELPEEFASAVERANQGITRSNEESLESLKRQRDGVVTAQAAAAEELLRLQATMQKSGESLFQTRGVQASVRVQRDVESIIKQQRLLQVELTQIDDEVTIRQAANQRRRLEGLQSSVKQQNTTFQLALRQLRQFNNRRAQQFDDANLKILAGFEKFRQQLSAQRLSEKDVDQFIDLLKEDTIQRIEDNFAKVTSGLAKTGAAYKKALSKRAASLRTVAQQMSDRRAELVNQITQINKAFQASTDSFNEQIEKQERQNQRMRDQLDAAQAGLDPALAKSQADREDASRRAEVTEGQFRSRLITASEKVATARKELEESITAKTALEARNRLQLAEGNLTATKRAFAAFSEGVILEEEKLTLEIRKRRAALLKGLLDDEKKLREDRAKILQENVVDSLDEVRKLIEEQKRSTADVEGFLDRLNTKFIDKTIPGFAQIQAELKQFADAASKATSAEQLEGIATGFPLAVSDAVDNVNEQLKTLEERLDSLRDKNRKSAQKDIINTKKEFERLVKAGLSREQAQSQALSNLAKRRSDRAKKESKLAEEIQKKEQNRVGLQKESDKAQTKLTAAVAARNDLLKNAVNLKEQEAALEAKALKDLDAKIEKNKELVRIIEQQNTARVDIGPKPIGKLLPPGAGSPFDTFADLGPNLFSGKEPAFFKGALEEQRKVNKETLEEIKVGFDDATEAILNGVDETLDLKLNFIEQAEGFRERFSAKGLV